MLKESTALHSGLVALATVLYGMPLVLGVVAADPRPLPPRFPDEGGEIVQAEARFTPIPVSLEPPEPAPEEEQTTPAPPAPTPILPPAPEGAVVTVEAPPAPPAATIRPGRLGPAQVSRPGAPRKARPARKVCDDPHPNVHLGADGIVEIDRSLVDEYTANLESFMQLGYSRPFDEEGVKGWYISGFGCGSPVYKAGFRRADVLLSVNGKPTRSWLGVFMLYQKLKNRDDFEIAVMRQGKELTLRFRVVPG